jgi:tRNA(adenine34) deaminase
MRVQDEWWMQQALSAAEIAGEAGEVPIGAIIVDTAGSILGQAGNLRETLGDPTAHAEICAIRAAARVTGSWRLAGCTIYVTIEPCMMCAGAIVQSRVARLVYGASNPKGGAIVSCARAFDVPGLNHRPEIASGVLEDRCAIMLERFFRLRRAAGTTTSE